LSKLAKPTFAATALIAIALLAGCSSADTAETEAPAAAASGATEGDPATGTYPLREDGLVAYSNIDESYPQVAEFVSQFRAAYPALAGSTDRPDKYVAKNGTAACAEIQRGTDEAGQISHAQANVVGDDVTTPATPEEAAGIIAIAVATICPA
jgi:hypothetical protein